MIQKLDTSCNLTLCVLSFYCYFDPGGPRWKLKFESTDIAVWDLFEIDISGKTPLCEHRKQIPMTWIYDKWSRLTMGHICVRKDYKWCLTHTVYPNKCAHGFVVLCSVVVMQSFIMNSHEVFIHIHQGCFAGTGAIVRLPQCQWSKPDGYGKISQCITTTKHSKAKTVCIFLGIYCTGDWALSTSENI